MKESASRANRGPLEKRELRTLYEVTAVVAREGELRRALDRIASIIARRAGYDAVAIERIDLTQGLLEIAAWSGPPVPAKLRALRVPLAATLVGKVARTGKPRAGTGGKNAALHPVLVHARLTSVIAVPLRTDGEVWGTLTVGTAGKHRSPAEDHAFLVTLATEISLLLTRRESERVIRESGERYRALIENALDAIFILDPASSKILDVNLRALEITGLTRRRLVGAGALSLAPKEEADRYRQALAGLASKGEIHALRTLHVRRRGGAPVPVEISARTVVVGEATLAIAIVRDITEQKKAEVQLTASEELLRIIVEGTLDMFFYVHNARGIFTYISPSVERITGRTVEEWKGHYERYMTDAPFNQRVRHNTERALQNGAVFPAYPCEVFHADGRRILLEIHERPIFRDGVVIGVQGVARDITEKRRLEEQLIQSQKMESIGLLAGGIAHDFNNILGGILGYASYLRSVVPAGDPIQQHLHTIERSALRAADLTAKLLAFARKGKYVVRPISLNAVVEETLRLLRGSLDRSIEIHERSGADLPAVEADSGQMQQVVMNLCVNARDAMPGGGRLTVSTDVVPWQTPFLVSQPEVRHVHYVRLTVQDTGVGIDRAILGKIFDPFFTTKEKGKGTGLGLATVYGIVKNHNGFVEVHSEIGAGTAFSVYLPAVEEEAVGVEEMDGEAAGGTETILVVDDEETIRRLLRDLLEAKGYRVLEASDGREALGVFDREKVDLVILDMVMPDMGGRETYVRLRERKGDVRTILSTGYAEDERARELMAMGVRAFVQKPYRAEDLARVVRSVLDAETPPEDEEQ